MTGRAVFTPSQQREPPVSLSPALTDALLRAVIVAQFALGSALGVAVGWLAVSMWQAALVAQP